MLQVEVMAWAKVLRWDSITERKPGVLSAVKVWESGLSQQDQRRS